MRCAWLVVVVGCQGAGSASVDPGPESEALRVTCAVQPDNALRHDCTATATTPGPLDVRWTPTRGGPSRGFTTESTGTAHAFTVYAMKPLTAYEVVVTGPDATVTVELATGPLPASVQPDLTATGAGTTPVLLSLPCADEDTLAIVDTDGELLWYQTYGHASVGDVDGGYDLTPQGTVLASLGGEIVETALDGTRRLHLARGVDFPDTPLHHDVHRGDNGLTYALFAEEVTEGDTVYVMDGFYAFDDVGLVAAWHLRDHFVPSGPGVTNGGGFWGSHFPGAADWAHANSIAVEASGHAYLSLRWLSAGLKVDATPGSPTFGEVAWTLVGDPTSDLAPGDFALSTAVDGPGDFVGQHHLNPTPDGRFALFDNREIGSSRGLILDLDPTAATATIEAAWEVGAICMAQGATFALASGNVLVTCATLGTVYEFAPGQAEPVWTLDLQCGPFAMVPRGVPAPI